MKALVYFYFITNKLLLLVLYSLLPKRGKFSAYLKFKIENNIFFSPRIKDVYPIKPELRGKIEPVRFMTGDCVKLYSWFIKPKEDKPVILFCHGQSENISKWQDTAIFIEKSGYGALFISYRGHYRSAGMPTEKGIYTDAEAAISFLKTKGYESKDIVVWGRSLGSTVACEMALRHNLKGIILESAIFNIKTAAMSLTELYLTKSNLPFLRKYLTNIFEKAEFEQKFENNKKIGKIDCPILILHSKNDIKIPYKIAEALHSENKQSKLCISECGTHDTNDWCFYEVKKFIKNLSLESNRESEKIDILEPSLITD